MKSKSRRVTYDYWVPFSIFFSFMYIYVSARCIVNKMVVKMQTLLVIGSGDGTLVWNIIPPRYRSKASGGEKENERRKGEELTLLNKENVPPNSPSSGNSEIPKVYLNKNDANFKRVGEFGPLVFESLLHLLP